MDPIIVKTPKAEYTLEDIDNYMDVHGIIHVREAIDRLNRENEKRHDPVRFIIRWLTGQE